MIWDPEYSDSDSEYDREYEYEYEDADEDELHITSTLYTGIKFALGGKWFTGDLGIYEYDILAITGIPYPPGQQITPDNSARVCMTVLESSPFVAYNKRSNFAGLFVYKAQVTPQFVEYVSKYAEDIVKPFFENHVLTHLPKKING